MSRCDLLAIGIVMADRVHQRGGGRLVRLRADGTSAPYIVLLAVLVLRWIPFHDVVIWRELIILAGSGWRLLT